MRDLRRRLLTLASGMLLVWTAPVFAQNPVTISGRVTNDAAAPLSFADVSIHRWGSVPSRATMAATPSSSRRPRVRPVGANDRATSRV